MQGVRTPSPMTIEVPSIVMIKRKNLAKWLFSSWDLILDALLRLLVGNSSLKLDTPQSSACWLGIKPTLAYRHISEYKANVPPEQISSSKYIIFLNLSQFELEIIKILILRLCHLNRSTLFVFFISSSWNYICIGSSRGA